MRRFLETIVSLLTAMLLVGTWLVQPFSVVSGSMHPTLRGPHYDFICPRCGAQNSTEADRPLPRDARLRCTVCGSADLQVGRLPIVPGEAVLVDRTVFWLRPPRRGEVIAFHLPNEEAKIAVKRVIGLPGERIELRDGKFLANGEAVALPTTVDYSLSRWDPEPRSWQLGPDEYFVAGDNPPVSDDSRRWPAGPGVAAQLIVGKPFIVHAPRRTMPWFGLPFHVPDVSAIRYIR